MQNFWLPAPDWGCLTDNQFPDYQLWNKIINLTKQIFYFPHNGSIVHLGLVGKCSNGHEKSGVQAEVMQGSRSSFSGVPLIFSLYLQSVRNNLSGVGCMWTQDAGLCFSLFFSVVTFFLYPISNYVYKAKQTSFFLELLSFSCVLALRAGGSHLPQSLQDLLFIFQINSGVNHSTHELYCWDGKGLEESK